MLSIPGHFAAFERDRVKERVLLGSARARRKGQKLALDGSVRKTCSESKDCQCGRREGIGVRASRSTTSDGGRFGIPSGGGLRILRNTPQASHSCR
jgi:hypothetical protein